MASTLTRLCDGLLQAGWLAALIAVPVFFNIHSERVFEPDKVALLRSIALLLAFAGIVRFVDGGGWRNLTKLRWSSEDSVWRKPFIAPVALLVAVYLTSTVFSLTPRVSWLGSYQRLQGTYTLAAYVIFFLAAISTMRHRVHVGRIPTAAIVASVPVGFYGLLQHYNLDPLPWGGDVQVRVAGHMGNAIFISAYLIMVVPLTLGRVIDAFSNILSDRQVQTADLVRSGTYTFALALQLLAIYWSGSRGPLLGLAVGIFSFFLVLLVSLRNAAPGEQPFGGRDALFSLVVIAPPLIVLLFSGTIGQVGTATFSFAAFLASLLLAVLLVLLLIILRRGWRWLWLSWLLLAVLVAGLLLLFNLPADTASSRLRNLPVIGSMLAEQQEWKELPNVGSYSRLFDPTQTTGREKSNRVRVLIWEGVIDLISPHEPLVFPDGRADGLNFWRPLIGYGPESMYVVYNRFYPPELATVEARNASPDRSHNETFDALVVTGLGGLVAWQLLYLSIFYYGFRYLGVVRSRRDRSVLVGAWMGGALLGALLPVALSAPIYLGVAIPLGTIVGLVTYLFYYALVTRSPAGDAEVDDTGRGPFQVDRLLINAVLASVLAHYVEVHLGIAIATTRLQLFLFMAIIFVIAYKIPQRAAAVEPVSYKTGRHVHHGAALTLKMASPLWAWMFLLALLVGTLGFEFMNYVLPPNTVIETGADLPAGAIFQQSLFINTLRGFSPSPFIFLLIVVSWVVGSLILLSEMVRQQEAKLTGLNVVGFAVLPLIIGLLYAYLQAVLLREALLYLVFFQGIEPVSLWFRLFFRPEEEIANIASARVLEAAQSMRFLTAYYLFLLAMLTLSGVAFARQGWHAAKRPVRSVAYVAAAFAVFVGVTIILQTNVRPIQADMVFKRGRPFDEQALRTQDTSQWDVAIAIYEKALAIAPWEDYYYLFLGRAYLERAALTEGVSDRLALLREAEERLLEARELNPLNTDHSANLARLQTRWAVADGATADDRRLDLAESYYQDALQLSPQNSVVRNELARLQFDLRRDCEAAIAELDRSLAIDPFYTDTYFIFSDVLSACAEARSATADGDELYRQAIVVLEQGLQLQPENSAAWIQAAQIHQRLGNIEAALEAVDRARDTNSAGRFPGWNLDFLAADIYLQGGDVAMARALGEQALLSAPESVSAQIEEFLEGLRQ